MARKTTRPTLSNPRYWQYTPTELRYVIKDAAEAALAMRDLDPVAEAKYLDQINDACTVLDHRNKLRAL